MIHLATPLGPVAATVLMARDDAVRVPQRVEWQRVGRDAFWDRAAAEADAAKRRQTRLDQLDKFRAKLRRAIKGEKK